MPTVRSGGRRLLRCEPDWSGRRLLLRERQPRHRRLCALSMHPTRDARWCAAALERPTRDASPRRPPPLAVARAFCQRLVAAMGLAWRVTAIRLASRRTCLRGHFDPPWLGPLYHRIGGCRLASLRNGPRFRHDMVGAHSCGGEPRSPVLTRLVRPTRSTAQLPADCRRRPLQLPPPRGHLATGNTHISNMPHPVHTPFTLRSHSVHTPFTPRSHPVHTPFTPRSPSIHTPPPPCPPNFTSSCPSPCCSRTQRSARSARRTRRIS